MVSSFWFWAAGSRLQKSLAGLFRTLLCQILRKEPELCRVAFPEWQIKYRDEDPLPEILAEAMHNVVRNHSATINYLFIIDGLDEYNRDNIGKTELVDIFLKMASCPNIKLLLSSRPETPFATGFRRCPSLRLETLTKPDITAYINAKLWSNPSLRDITQLEETEVRRIADYVSENAEGVFLWVVLVLNIVQTGLNDHDDITTIHSRTLQLPHELESLFKHILEERTLAHHKVEAFRYLLIALEWQKLLEQAEVPGIVLAVGQLASNHGEVSRLINLPLSDIKHHENQITRRLASRCHGLLEPVRVDLQRPNEVSGNPDDDDAYVTFLHRTLFDFLLRQQEDLESDQAIFRSGVGHNFRAHEAIMVGISAHLRHNVSQSMAVDAYLFLRFMEARSYELMRMARLIAQVEQSTGRPQTEMVITFEGHMSESLQHLVPAKKASHWTDLFFVFEHDWSGASFLAYAVLHGASLCLGDIIERNDGTLPAPNGSYLLSFAVPSPSREMSFRVDERRGPASFLINEEAAILLLKHGADPVYEGQGHNAWQHAILWLRYTDRPGIFVKLLPLMKLMVKHASDRSKLATIKVGTYTAHAAIQKRLKERCWCYSGKPVKSCDCDTGRTYTLLARELLLLIRPRKNGWFVFLLALLGRRRSRQ